MKETSELLESIEVLMQKILQRMDETNEVLTRIAVKDTVQEVIRPEEADSYLSNNWKYVSSFNNGRDTFIIVEIDADLRR